MRNGWIIVLVGCAPFLLTHAVGEADETPMISDPNVSEKLVRIEASDAGFTFLSDDRAVLFYQREPVTEHNHTRAGYVHPLTGLDGEVFTSKGIVAEQTRIRVHRAVGDVQYVDFTIQLTPLAADVKVGGSEDAKGYSGFTVRVKPPADMIIRDANGVLASDAVQSTSSWAGVSGSFGERGVSGVAILSHPSLTQFPPRWVLRHYGMQNVAYPGREPILLSPDQPLVIRHRLVLHRGSTQAARIADHQRIFELTP